LISTFKEKSGKISNMYTDYADYSVVLGAFISLRLFQGFQVRPSQFSVKITQQGDMGLHTLLNTQLASAGCA